MGLIVVSGALANKPANGGATWTRLNWILGFSDLGHDVFFLEQIAPSVCVDDGGAPCEPARSINFRYFAQVTSAFGLADRSALLLETGDAGAGEIARLAESADLLVNISGHLTLESLKSKFRRRAFVDLDPGYTQVWHAEGLAEDRLRDHDVYFTVGTRIGTEGCSIPTGGIDWRPVRQPVVLREWPVTPAVDGRRFTTVASWRGAYGRVSHAGVEYGLKAHEFRKFAALPERAGRPMEIALDIDPADGRDVDVLRGHGWTIVDPKIVASGPAGFRRYVQESGAEFSVAQGIYTETQSGWFSDRTVRYLSSGKPAVVQDTGWTSTLPVGCGLLPFRTLDEAASSVKRIERDYDAHARGARAIAEEYFDSSKVLEGVLREAGLTR